MKKSVKALRIILLSVLILIVVVVIAVNLFANRAIKMAIETVATKTLDVPVRVKDVDFGVIRGKFGFSGLLVDNPPGYQHDKLLELNNALIEVNVKSLLSDTVHMRKFKLDGVNVVLEQKGISNNINDILKALPKGDKPSEPAKPSEPSGKTLLIDRLEISNVTVKAKLLPVPGKADTVTLTLDPIVMNDLGSDSKMDIAKLCGKILMAIAGGVAEKGTGVLPDEMTNTMKSTLNKSMEIGKTAAKEGKELLETGKESGKEALKTIEGLKGLLKKPEDSK